MDIRCGGHVLQSWPLAQLLPHVRSELCASVGCYCTVAGMPKQGTQLERKATVRCVQVVANMSFSGMASNHLVV